MLDSKGGAILATINVYFHDDITQAPPPSAVSVRPLPGFSLSLLCLNCAPRNTGPGAYLHEIRSSIPAPSSPPANICQSIRGSSLVHNGKRAGEQLFRWMRFKISPFRFSGGEKGDERERERESLGRVRTLGELVRN